MSAPEVAALVRFVLFATSAKEQPEAGQVKMSRPFKIRKLGESEKYGVAASSLDDLIRKGCKKIESVSESGAQCCLYEDGTIITEDYFPHVPNNAEVVLLSAGQKWRSSIAGDLHRILSHDDNQLINAARDLLQSDDGNNFSAIKRRILGELQLDNTTHLERREEDEDWFKGIDKRFKTKSAYMKYNCERRIRGYLKEVVDHAQTINNVKVKREYEKLVECLKEILKIDQYNGSYFDRMAKKQYRLCTDEGWFSCQGAFDEDMCKSHHSINPYDNHDKRVLFSTWNLDHQIEKKRTILPTLTKALQEMDDRNINQNYFYGLLFTRRNLKLVDIVCHKKVAHNLHCDSRLVYTKSVGKSRRR